MLAQSRRNLLLLAVLGLLVAVAVLLPEGSSPTRHRLLASAPADIRVQRIGPDGQRVLHYHLYREMQEGEDRWMIEAPGLAATIADPTRAEGVQQSLLAPSARTWTLDEIPFAETGLDSPGHIVIANGKELAFGSRGALGNQRYASDGERVLLVSDIISYHLQRDPRSLLPQDAPAEPQQD